MNSFRPPVDPESLLEDDLNFYVWTLESYDKLTTLTQSYDHETMADDDIYVGDSFKETNPKAACTVCVFGTTKEGHSVLLRAPYDPFVFLEFDSAMSEYECQFWIRQNVWGCSSVEEKRYKHLWGWEPDPDDPSQTARHRCFKVRLPSASSIFFLAKRIEEKFSDKVTILENKVSVTHKFGDEANIVPSTWIRVPKDCLTLATDCRASHAQIEVILKPKAYLNIECRPDDETEAPLVVASFDIETYSHTGAFPLPDVAENVIMGIGTTVWNSLTKQMKHFYFGLKSIEMSPQQEPPNDANDANESKMAIEYAPRPTVRTFETEEEMLLAWRDFVVLEVDPDILTGYNLVGFDNHYMATRMNRETINENESRFFYLGRIWANPTPLKEESFSSSARGSRVMHAFGDLSGRVSLDMYILVNIEHKLKNYGLDAVSKHFLGMRKVDLPHKELFKAWEADDPKKRGEIAIYCSMDCGLPILLMDYMCVIPNLCGMSRVTYTPVTDIIKRGQQIKCYNQIARYAHQEGFVMNAHRDVGRDYEGATVLAPEVGFYTDPIVTLDFASLYPSIIRDQNLCCSTLVDRPEHRNFGPETGVTYNVIEASSGTHHFVSHTDGVLPRILKNLLNARKAVKKQMKECPKGDKARFNVLNGRQLAIKVSANSIYGFTGAGKTGMYSCLPVADSTTARGRIMIQRTRNLIMDKYTKERGEGKVNVIYGDTDSVMVRFFVEESMAGVEEAFRLGLEAANYVSSQFGDAVTLEMEKVYWPYGLFKKKRYAGMKYEKGKDPVIDVKGIEMVRRDTSDFAAKTCEMVLDAVLRERNVEKAQVILLERLDDMVSGRVPFEDFIISKSINASKQLNDHLAHVAVVEKIKKRAPGSEPRSGDRVQYVILCPKTPHDKLYERVEEAQYAKEHNLRLDWQHYIDALKTPIVSFFENFIPDPERLFIPAEVKAKQARLNVTSIFSQMNLTKSTNDKGMLSSVPKTYYQVSKHGKKRKPTVKAKNNFAPLQFTKMKK